MKKWVPLVLLFGISSAIITFYINNKKGNKKDLYEYVPNDPMKTRIYTLENGLKVYLSVNKKEPRIQANIVVRVGSKNDPAETTGLAHYLEHLIFKGTKQCGSIDYEKEKPYLDKIEELYETYRKTTDDQKRKDIYKQIDKLSHEASKYAIANEYDKLMKHLGSQGSNAYTNNDSTWYTENIPANQIDNWARIQSDRFKNMIIRGFHTELEAVYEEYNYRVRDTWKMYYKTNEMLFSNHPYGLQTTIGKQEHLKNPSIKNIKEFFKKWYVPNNIAICMSGDLDYDKTINIIKKYFNDWKPNPNIKKQHETIEKIKVPTLQEPKISEVFGNESESIMISWVIPGLRANDLYQTNILENILSNKGNIGLIDTNILQEQKVSGVWIYDWIHSDYSSLHIIARPKEGQTLEEVKSLLLEEITKLKNGNFDDDLIKAIINNLKLEHTKNLEDNEYRVDNFLDSFISQHEWKYSVDNFNRLNKLTKEDIIKWANKYLTNGYSCIYKRKGIDPNEEKIDKPEITSIITNSDKTSQFAEDIMKNEIEPIKPIFIDYQKDMTIKKYDNGNEILYKQNIDNELFDIEFKIYKGTKADNTLDIALDYLNYLGTSTSTNNELKKELYKLACNFYTTNNPDETIIKLSGLSNNMEQAFMLIYKWIIDAKSDKKIYDNVVEDIVNRRNFSKTQQESNLQCLIEYGKKGNINVYTNRPSIDELKSMNPQILLNKLLNLLNCQKTILYYGPLKLDQVEKILQIEISQNQLEKTTKYDCYYNKETPQNEVLLATYDAKNTYLCVYSNTNQKYDITLTPQIYIFKEYFRNLIYQDIREKRGLAYLIWGGYFNAWNKIANNIFFIETSIQNDKLYECLDAINNVIDNMLIDEGNFNIAKNAVINSIVTKRFTGTEVLHNYLDNCAKGLSESESIYVYDHVKNISLKDFIQFYEKYIKNCKRKYMILAGDKKYINTEKLKSFGQVKCLTQNDIFGY